ncbi:site-specific DNA-methyltransferase [Bacillaceae bacterium Marseille-Q3522]|nr:site-specific DNA-methyltransferase [Bacillaceae bacterium Marseille-Q3522]
MKSIFTQKENLLYANNDCILILNNCLNTLKNIKSESVDMIFADPPYFLSNGGITCKSGKIGTVDKGYWDKETDRQKIDRFNFSWIKECRRILKKSGTIWITGTFHNIFSVGQALTYLNFKILNDVIWQKSDPPPNISHRMFTHSSEHLIWAKKSSKSKHTFNYQLLIEKNNGKQMTDVWKLPAVQQSEKLFGYHPTQKPLHLLKRVIISSTCTNNVILDPFCGSGTTGVAAILLRRKFIGIENENSYIKIAIKRVSSVYKNRESHL